MESERRYNRKTGLWTLSERDRENLLACVQAELELLSISGKDYEGPLVQCEIAELCDLLGSAKEIYVFP